MVCSSQKKKKIVLESASFFKSKEWHNFIALE